MKKAFLMITLGSLMLSACKDINTFTLEDNQGAFILNKGNSETSTLSRYDYERETMTNTIFQKKNNGLKLGPGASAFLVKRSEDYLKGRGYVVFTERGEVDMINMENYRVEATVEGLSYPNDIVLANENTAYVSCGNGVLATSKDNVVAKIDLNSHTITKTISVGVGPGKMITSGKYLYIANNGGQMKNGTSVTVIDMSKDEVIATVEVGIQPVDMAVDIDRNVWVYCDGDASGNNQSLYLIDRGLEGESVVNTPKLMLDLGTKIENGQNALAVSRDGRFVFYVHGKTYFRSVYKKGESDVLEEGESLEPDAEAITGDYNDIVLMGVDVDSRTGKLQGLINDGNGQGTFVQFEVKDSRYEASQTYEVGINPVFTTYFY